MSHDSNHQHGIGIYVVIFAALLILTAVTVGAAFIDFGSFNTVIALVIAFVKATLVILFFMHLKGSPGLLKLFVIGAFAWLTILLGFTLNDYMTRSWGTQVESESWINRTPHQYYDVPQQAESHGSTSHH